MHDPYAALLGSLISRWSTIKRTIASDRIHAEVRRLVEDVALLEQVAVEQRRRDGDSWAVIGLVYGITAQGAQQRFGPVRSRAGRAEQAGGVGSPRSGVAQPAGAARRNGLSPFERIGDLVPRSADTP